MSNPFSATKTLANADPSAKHVLHRDLRVFFEACRFPLQLNAAAGLESVWTNPALKLLVLALALPANLSYQTLQLSVIG